MPLKAKINFRLVLIAHTCPSRLKQFDRTCGSRLILLVEADWSYLSSRGSRLIVLVPMVEAGLRVNITRVYPELSWEKVLVNNIMTYICF